MGWTSIEIVPVSVNALAGGYYLNFRSLFPSEAGDWLQSGELSLLQIPF